MRRSSLGIGAPIMLLLAGCTSMPTSAVEVDPWHEARRASRAERWERAAALWEDLLEVHGREFAEPWIEYARATFELGNTDLALDRLARGIEQHPGEAALYALRGELYHRLGYLRAAELDLQSAASRSPDDAALWLRLGALRLELGLPQRAATALRRCIGSGGGDAETYGLFARALREAGHPTEAFEVYGLAASSAGVSIDALVEGAEVVASGELEPATAGSLELALSWTERAIESDPQYAHAHFVRSLLLERSGDVPEAIESYRRTVEVDGLHARAWTNLACLYQRLGKSEEARQLASVAIDLETSPRRLAALRAILE